MKRIKKLFFTTILSFSLISISPMPIDGFHSHITAEASQKKSTTVYITKTGKKYHKKKCGNGKYIKSTLDKAKALGLTKCSKCY